MPHVLYIDQIFDTTLIRIKALTFCVVHHIIQSFKSILMSYFYLENARVRILCYFHIIFILAFYIQGIKSKMIIQDRTRDLTGCGPRTVTPSLKPSFNISISVALKFHTEFCQKSKNEVKKFLVK